MSAGATLKVLYAEDDRISTVLMTQIMALEPGIELRVAEDGAEALAAIDDDWQPDLLVLDAHLPDTTGHALLARLRALPGLQQVPACMCSADSLAADRQRAAEAGFNGYWTKPIPVPAVLACLRTLKAARC